ncbi:2-hydroxyacid dehydrogenase [Paraburkholderia fynbosensis]|uniref:2-ketogluconate reductase n=1 Tax=Paraburkholderia fynbosensis TaxID=1200993 RepID=A0A6J5GY53_9BURK|nr:2-hydroxyacid dehydrogenase [Paraburkholderia fynbosensis]CAB3807036.1 2-ketogluconate reductase [Paraburkholderia fynbosensis]
MSESKTLTLQLCPFSEYLEAGLNKHLQIVRWFELDDQAQNQWLEENAARVRAVATGGHIGCPSDLMLRLPSLGIVAINGVGFDKVDLNLAKARRVHVTNTPDVLTDDVADLAVGLIISLLREIPAAHAHVRAGEWPNGDVRLARKVTGRRFGIVGLGRIGSAIASRLKAFGPICYTDIERKDVQYEFHADLNSLARASDVLILASSANASTRHLIKADTYSALGNSGYLVNVARGSLVDEQALIEALNAGTIAGAALDVFEHEPNIPEALLKHPGVVLTPHVASATVETRTRMADIVLGNLEAYVGQRPLLTALV